MPYILYNSNGTQLATIADGSINSSATPLTFVGKNYAGYGTIVNQNLLYLLQNFSNITPPTNPVIGQLWYNTANKALTVYNGRLFKSISTFNNSSLQPSNSSTGDFWFNELTQQLYFYNGTSFVLVGPENPQSNRSSVIASNSLGTDQNQHYTLNFNVTDDTGLQKIIAVASKDEFNPDPSDPLFNQNYTVIKQGITLPTSDATNGNSISNSNEGAYYFWGTAATAAALVYPTNAGAPAIVHPATDFFLYADWQDALNNGLHINNNYGLIIANGRFIFQYTGSSNIGEITNQGGSQIDFQVNINASVGTVLSIIGQSLVPATTLAFDLGTPSNTYNNIYANTVTTKVINYNTLNGVNILSNELVTGHNGLFDNFTATNFTAINATITTLGSTNANIGSITVTGDQRVQGNLNVDQNATVNGNLTIQSGSTPGTITANNINLNSGFNLNGNVFGNLNGVNNVVTATSIFSTITYVINIQGNPAGNLSNFYGNVNGIGNNVTATNIKSSGITSVNVTSTNFTSAGLVVGQNAIFSNFTATTFTAINAVISNLQVDNISANTLNFPPAVSLTVDIFGNVNGIGNVVTATTIQTTNFTTVNINSTGATKGHNGMFDNFTATNITAGRVIVENTGTFDRLETSRLIGNGGFSGTEGQIYGQWSLDSGATLSATYSDLAERYHADAVYGYGTVLIVGGTNEVTTTDIRANTSVAGVVSKAPAYMMNEAAGPDETHPYLALKGRIPCNVVGIIHKGDRLVTSKRHGYAEAFQIGDSPNAVLGIALKDHLTDFGIIEIKV
jgi:hypothetical protein